MSQNVTEDEAIHSDRAAEVSRGRSTSEERRKARTEGSGKYISRSQERQAAEKPILFGLPDSRRSEAPRGVHEGTESLPGDASYRKPGYTHVAQPAEPPDADPHVLVVWEGRTSDRLPYPDALTFWHFQPNLTSEHNENLVSHPR
jgi:hypothetical protein